jgi:hypothetical protein
MGDEMNLPPVKREWNINTIISLAGFVLTLAGGVYAYGQLTLQVGYTSQELAAYRAATDVRITAVELAARQFDRLEFRIGAAEDSNASIARGLDDLQSAVANQSGDIRVIVEIVKRLEDNATPASFTPLAAIP